MWRLLGAFWQLSFDCESNESCKQRMMKCVLYQGFVVILCVLSKTLAACNWGFAGLMISPQIYSSLAAMARVLQIWWERNRFQQKIKVGKIWQIISFISLVHINVHIYSISKFTVSIPNKKTWGSMGTQSSQVGIPVTFASQQGQSRLDRPGASASELARRSPCPMLDRLFDVIWCHKHNNQPGMVNNYQG